MSIFGAKVAIVYVIVGLIIAVIGGTIIEKLHMERYVERFILTAGSVDIESPDLTKRDRLTYAGEQTLSTFKKVLPYLLIGVGGGVQLLLGAEAGFVDATEPWGLNELSDRSGAIRQGVFIDFNGDRRPDLLVNSTVWLNQGNRFLASGTAEIPGAEQLLTIAPQTPGDNEPAHLVTLRKTGELALCPSTPQPGKTWPAQSLGKLWNAAPADLPLAAAIGRWGGDGKLSVVAVRNNNLTRHSLNPADEPADFHRMTGEKPEALGKAFPKGLAGVQVLAGSFTGGSGADCLILADGGGLLLVHRGYGTFFLNPDAAARLRPSADRPLPFQFAPSLRWAVADLHGDGYAELLVLTEDGVLYEMENPRPKP
jgi:hypothetical protein